jgi:hypothetical protein
MVELRTGLDFAAVRLLAIGVLVLAIASCGTDAEPPAADAPTTTATSEPSPSPSPSPQPRLPDRDLEEMANTFDAYTKAYNAGDYARAIRFADPSIIASTCGSETAFADALRQNYDIEFLDYVLVRVDLAVSEGEDRATADVYYDSFDPSTGEQVDFDLGSGLAFSKINGEWLLADAFPLGTSVFC